MDKNEVVKMIANSKYDVVVLKKIKQYITSDKMSNHQPTNKEDADAGNISAIRHVSYAEGYRDGKDLIKDKLKSLMNQDYSDHEIINEIKKFLSKE